VRAFLAGVGRAQANDVCPGLERTFDSVEPLVHRAPLAGDEVDEQTEVVDPRMTFGEKIRFEALEATDHLIGKAFDLGKSPRDRSCFVAQPVTERIRDCLRQDNLQLGGRLSERLNLESRPFEGGRDIWRQ
jgi:hypothetical protein